MQNWLFNSVALNVKPTSCPEIAKLISSNPANYIKVPKNAPTNTVKRHIIAPEKLAELLAKYPFGSPYYIPILIFLQLKRWQNQQADARKYLIL